MNNTNPTSFQSILAGVAKLRQEKAGEDASKPVETRNDSQSSGGKAQLYNASPQKQSSPIKNTPTESPQIINAFNQQRFTETPPDSDINRKRPFNPAAKGKTVLVSNSQKENPLLNHLKNTNWRYIKSTPGNKVYYDYMVRNRSILFLTLSYHKLYIDYIERRMLPLKKNNDNILIFVVDDTNSEDILKDITKLCMFNGFTLLLAFNFQQAAKYIEGLNI